MTLGELVAGYFTYPGIQIYGLLSAICVAIALYFSDRLLPLIVAAVATGLVYPLVWYLLHRFVLHGTWLYKRPETAAVWKRIHFDHHQDPHNLAVLFGALYTTVPTILAVAVPIGWAVGGLSAAAAAVASGLVVTCFYEFCHCIQHLRFTPKSRILMLMKKRHLAHHFHSERGNFGITNFMWDRLFGTYYPDPKTFPVSATTFNLGYTAEEAERYPWVAELSGLTIANDAAQANGAAQQRADLR
ncbi:MAG: sterol desaturase family protein [Proteobacteria bacterium]|nr:sterol desaturase family protein [Pseudomonadota bacterium]MDA1325949.1 sterol desaturase family protein [Pseudomonadota bacterium]